MRHNIVFHVMYPLHVVCLSPLLYFKEPPTITERPLLCNLVLKRKMHALVVVCTVEGS